MDILLGPGVEELGGLMVIGTIRHDSLRIDNQLRGRSGRQGDAGSSRFFISMEDELLMNDYPDHLLDELVELDHSDDVLIEDSRYIKGIRDAQLRIEGEMRTVRERLMVYDQVLNLQRTIVYTMRNEVLESNNLTSKIQIMIQKTIEHRVSEFCHDDVPENWDIIGLTVSVGTIFPYKRPLRLDRWLELEPDGLTQMILQQLMAYYDEKAEAYEGDVLELQRQAYLHAIDFHWLQYLESVDEVKNGIDLRSYASLNPIVEYERETYRMFNEFFSSVEQETLRTIWNRID
ncbi:preprotein translocase subunit SecA [compost metagenome]